MVKLKARKKDGENETRKMCKAIKESERIYKFKIFIKTISLGRWSVDGSRALSNKSTLPSFLRACGIKRSRNEEKNGTASWTERRYKGRKSNLNGQWFDVKLGCSRSLWIKVTHAFIGFSLFMAAGTGQSVNDHFSSLYLNHEFEIEIEEKKLSASWITLDERFSSDFNCTATTLMTAKTSKEARKSKTWRFSTN